MSLALAANVAAIAGQGFASALFGVCDMISNSANAVRFNKEVATALASQIRDIVSALSEEQALEDFKPSPEWTAGISSFKCTLDTIMHDLQGISKQTLLAQALHHERDAEALRGMGQCVRDVTTLFMTKARIEILDHVQVLNTALESATKAVTAPSVPAQHLEPPPAYYFGRTAETESAATMLDSDLSAYVAILGGPGMGKTSLARAVLHHPALATRFGPKRYFVACDAADSRMTLLSLLSSAFGIATSTGSAAQQTLTSILRGPSLLVLDNFESAWESVDQRQETETLLGFLASTHGLSIMITLRGSERPHGVPWTTPHLPLLATLGSGFSTQLFVSISDIDEVDPNLSKLLTCTDGVPLAIVLLANLAQYESSHALVTRWEEQKTAMLHYSDGSHRLTSMDVSLSLSLTSPRVTACPAAVQLLGLLSMLPQGAPRYDIEAWFPVKDVGRSISVLLQTALAVWNCTDRLYVLAPIREFMLSKHYPQLTALASLFTHYWGLAQLIDPEGQESSSLAAVGCVLPELQNIYSVTFHGLNNGTHEESAAAAAVSLAYLLVDTGHGSFDILNKALLVSRECSLDNITASLLFLWGMLACRSAVPGDSQILWKEAQSLYNKTGNLGGIIDTTLRLATFEPPEQAVRVTKHMYTLAKGAREWRRAVVSLQFLAFAHDRLGNYTLALQYQQESIDIIYSKLSDFQRLLGWSLASLGDSLCSVGQLGSGMTKLKEAVPLLLKAQNYSKLGDAEQAIAEMYLLMRMNLRALVHIRQALNAYQQAQDPKGRTACFHFCVMANLAVGDSHAALGAIASAGALLGDGSVNLGASSHALFMHAKGAFAAATGDLDAANSFFQGAIMFSQVEDSNEVQENCQIIESVVLCSLGELEQVKGHRAEARKCFIISVAIFHQFSQGEYLQSLTYLAQVIEDESATHLLAAIMPPLMHSGLNGLLADAFLTSADIALRQSNTQLAYHRVQSAMRYLEEVDTVKLHERANMIVEKCIPTLSV